MSDINNYNYQQTHDRRLAASICVAANVQVIAFDPVKMTVNVQPLSKQLENGKYESQPPILRVPVACTRCGGFIFRPWFNIGDTGTVVYLDHDLDRTLAEGKEVVPLTERNHSTSDAVFVGAIITGSYEAKNLLDESLSLATDDGKIYIAVSQTKVAIKNAETTAEFTADAINMNTKEVSINASGIITIKGAKVYIN